MVAKLKTLKDLIQINDDRLLLQDNPIMEINKYIIFEELRQEVIKWLIVLDNELEILSRRSLETNLEVNKSEILGCVAVREWIKMFFNITSEELA